MPPRGKPRGGNFYLVSSNNIRTFAFAFESERSKQEKHYNIVLSLKSAKFLLGGRAFVLSLDCVCYIPVAYLQA